MVSEAGLEPATYSLGENCSIQLSYSDVGPFNVLAQDGGETTK